MPSKDTQFKKGEVANPNGRPKGSGLNLTSLLKDKLEEIPDGKKEAYKDLFIKTLLHKGLVEKDLQSLKLIMNYVDGLPKQDISLTATIDKVEGFKITDDNNNQSNNKTEDSLEDTTE